jgi:hypothetical protein
MPLPLSTWPLQGPFQCPATLSVYIYLPKTSSRHAGREVLERFDDFTLGESIEPGMPWGNFLMTVDWRQRHAQERQLCFGAGSRS